MATAPEVTEVQLVITVMTASFDVQR